MTEYIPKVWQELTNHYQEIQPDLRLSAYIQSYWFSYTRPNQEPARIIPDLCSDLIVQLTPALEILSVELCGPSTTFFYSYAERELLHLGIRFHLGGMYPFINQSFKELKNQLRPLIEVEKALAKELAAQLSGKATVAELIRVLNQYFLKQLNRMDRQISAAIPLFIHEYSAYKSYESLTAKTLISERSLQRLFKEEIGLTPYEVFDVLRFQNVYQEITKNPQIKQLDLVEKYGFADQSHYSKKMKRMTGLTPQEMTKHVGIIQDKNKLAEYTEE
ncbi:AraC family transcriptional regulator [Enterococcus wangshanyuanii]|uniref:AraC family transcriptional regulator n=1 Tax=Enterococcus wangshanyuanii TaxID=2005703 RepID=A0ABQ1PK99_9ENTE|nr:helix-turn-helix domain-containing protein [Enterococcus wangshanyuanii]GGC98701.1 AraC family transcriptional regulator [Enterococcus wangshanyuanii]